MEHCNRNASICACPEAEILVNLLLRKPYEQVSRKKLNAINCAITSDIKLSHWQLQSIPYEQTGLMTNVQLFNFILIAYKNRVKPEASHVLFKEQNLMRFFVRYGKSFANDFTFMVLLRDCRAILNSQLHSIVPETGRAFSDNSFTVVLYYIRFVKKLKRIIQANRLPVLSLRYEDLLSDFKTINAIVCERLQIEDRNNDDSYHAKMIPAHAYLHCGINKPLQKKTIHKWETGLDAYEKWLASFLLPDKNWGGYRYDKTPFQFCYIIRMLREIFRFSLYFVFAKIKWLTKL